MIICKCLLMFNESRDTGYETRMKMTLDSICLKLWRYIVIANAGGVSEISGNKGESGILEAHHLVGCGYWPTRHNPYNGLAVTREEHQNPWLIDKWLAKHRPKQWKWVCKQRRLWAAGSREPKPNLLKTRDLLQTKWLQMGYF